MAKKSRAIGERYIHNSKAVHIRYLFQFGTVELVVFF
jgi:hypothetical protein